MTRHDGADRRRLLESALAAAEHGLGKRKAHLLGVQYGPEEIEAMQRVKRRLDPEWRLGRGTLFAAPGE